MPQSAVGAFQRGLRERPENLDFRVGAGSRGPRGRPIRIACLRRRTLTEAHRSHARPELCERRADRERCRYRPKVVSGGSKKALSNLSVWLTPVRPQAEFAGLGAVG